MNQYRLLLIQIQTLPLSMHHKWKEMIDFVYKTTNEKSKGGNSQQKTHCVHLSR